MRLLTMSLIVKAWEIKALDRSFFWGGCLGLSMADQDWMVHEPAAKNLSLLERALLHWWTLDSTRSQSGLKQWCALSHVSGHFDAQHRADCLIPEVLHIEGLGSLKTAQKIIPRRNVAFELEASADQMLAWWQSVHMSDHLRGIETFMTVLSL